jgi:putative transposase
MSWLVAMQIFSMLLDWVRLGRKSDQENELKILLLRHQLAILERKQTKVVRASRADKLILAVLAIKLKDRTRRTIKELGEVIRIIKPETVLNWHRELVRRKWTQRARTLKKSCNPLLRQESA